MISSAASDGASYGFQIGWDQAVDMAKHGGKWLRLSRQIEATQAAGGQAEQSAAARAGQRMDACEDPGQAESGANDRIGAKTQHLTGDRY